ncbi:hypothetical protein NVP1161O_154 [Vibrio phage 1.161.O._10N.261.48.C5]|nr:hypothetical protein NVP1161O_154 [Vibrio phage 1.161.O._10N.261.48.C5]
MSYQVCNTRLVFNIRKDLEKELRELCNNSCNPNLITIAVNGKVWVQGEAILTTIGNPSSVSACREYKDCEASLSVIERVHLPSVDPYEKVPFTAGDIDYE